MVDCLPTRSHDTRSLGRALLLARLLATNVQLGWRLSDLARAADLEMSTTHRLLRGLIHARLAFRISNTRRYTLGPLAFELGLATRVHHDLGRPAGALLAAAAQDLQGTVYVMAHSGLESVCLVRSDCGVAQPGLMLQAGGRRPLIQTAGGLAILFELPRVEQDLAIAVNRSVLDRRERALLSGIDRMMARSREVGYPLNLGDVVPGINALALAVRDGGARVLGSLVFAQACPPWSAERISQIRAELARCSTPLQHAWCALRY